MADISRIKLPGEELAYDLKDGFAREAYVSLSTQLETKADISALPPATAERIGGIKIGYVQDGHNYPVQLDGGKAYVNVPWTDVAVQSAWYEPQTREIVIRFNDEALDQISVDVADLVDTYSGGQTPTVGVEISDNVISASVRSGSITPELVQAGAEWIFDCNHY